MKRIVTTGATMTGPAERVEDIAVQFISAELTHIQMYRYQGTKYQSTKVPEGTGKGKNKGMQCESIG